MNAVIRYMLDLAQVTATLFIVLDPFSLIPFIFSFTGRMSPKESHKMMYRVILGATVLLLFFTISGTWLLRFFGVTLNDLRIAGGLLLMIISLQLVLEGHAGGDDERERREISEAPLISPLLVGPGAITAAVVLATDYGVVITAIGAVLAMFASLLVFLSAGFLHKLIGSSGTDLARRVVGVLIAAVGISYIRIGITELVSRK